MAQLIRPLDKYSPTKSDINFGFGLRKYNSLSGFKLEKPWRIPKFKGLRQFDPIESEFLKTKTINTNRNSVDEESVGLSVKKKLVSKASKYNDQFPQRNASGIRHMFGKTCQIGSIKWESGLRFGSDKDLYLNTRKPSKNQI